MIGIVEAANEKGWEIHSEHERISLSWVPFFFASSELDVAQIPKDFRFCEIVRGAGFCHQNKAQKCPFSPELCRAVKDGGYLLMPQSVLSWLRYQQQHPDYPMIQALHSWSHRQQNWQIKSQALDLSTPAIMGIWNVTPDSFSSALDTDASSVQFAQQLCENGADILDIGAESTRPGAVELTSEIEIARLKEPLKWAKDHIKCPVSLDSRHPQTLQYAAENGYIDIINDVALGDPTLPGSNQQAEIDRQTRICNIAQSHRLGLVLMAWQPHDAPSLPFTLCLEKIVEQIALRMDCAFNCGMNMQAIVVDPGIGFGKGLDNDYRLIFEAPQALSIFGRPVLIAHSRKRCLAQFTASDKHTLDLSTAITAAFSIQRGAAVIRVHNTADAAIARSLVAAIRSLAHV